MSWVLRHSEETLGKRLVLLVLADHAHDDGTEAWPSLATIASETRLSERQVRYALRGLEASGAIIETGRSRTGTHIYTVATGANIAGGSPPPEQVSQIAPEPSLEQPSSVSSPNGSLTRERAWTVDRKPVKWEHAALAAEVLTAWNRATGQELRSRDWLAKIVMRIREYPEATFADHQHIIERNLAHPWWSGPPTPSVVYGSGAQFERAVMTARHAEGDADRIERIVNAVMDRRQQ